tara:strand:+ start:278 stop:1264 length:987 start_codon:yes stop_codon:yes gene_type:complete
MSFFKKSEYQILNKFLKIVIQNFHNIIKISIFSFIISFFSSFLLTNYYKSSTIFVLSNSESETSQIQGLANLAGISLTNSDNYVDPILYPNMMSDLFLKREILQININDSLTLKNYLLQTKKNRWINFDKLFNFSSGVPTDLNSEFYLDENEVYLFNKLDEILKLSVDQRNKFITLSATYENKLVIPLILNGVKEILQMKIIELKIKSSKEFLSFVQKNFNSKEKDFLKIQDKLAKFKDNNQMISSSVFNNELFILQNEFNLIQNVYTELARQLETAKLDVSKNTPIFTTIKNPIIPTSKIFPNRFLISFLFSFSIILFYLIFLRLKS